MKRTLLCGDDVINHERRIPIRQVGLHLKYPAGFFRGLADGGKKKHSKASTLSNFLASVKKRRKFLRDNHGYPSSHKHGSEK